MPRTRHPLIILGLTTVVFFLIALILVPSVVQAVPSSCYPGCGAGYCCTSFLAGTEIAVDENGKTVKIEQLKVGNPILSFIEENGDTRVNKIVFIREGIRDYYFVIGAGEFQVKASANHPFYVGSNYRSWDPAVPRGYKRTDELEIGDRVYVLSDDNRNLREVTISKIRRINQPAKVYSLTVDNDNNYFAERFAVHNKYCARCYNICKSSTNCGIVYGSGTDECSGPEDCGAPPPTSTPTSGPTPTGPIPTEPPSGCESCGGYGDIQPCLDAGCVWRYASAECACSGCFLPETQISTSCREEELMCKEERVAIEELKAGDVVISFDEETGALEEGRVKEIYKSKRGFYYELETESGYKVKTTAEHPFFVGGGEYKEVGELRVRDIVYVEKDNKLSPEKIVSLRRINKSVEVYNLTVEGDETFFADSFAVHNKCFLPGTKIKVLVGVEDENKKVSRWEEEETSIEDLKEGDLVVAFDEKTGQIGISKVAAVRKRQSDHFFNLETVSGYKVKVTGEHPFYVGNGEYKKVKELGIGDAVYIEKGGELVEDKIELLGLVKEPVDVYNLTVEKETFFADSFAVHNKGGTPDTTKPECGVEIEPSFTGGNLVTNGDFETGDLTGWTDPDGNPISLNVQEKDSSHQWVKGNYSLWANTDYKIRQDIPVKKGKLYRLIIWGRGQAYKQGPKDEWGWGDADFYLDPYPAPSSSTDETLIVSGYDQTSWKKFEMTAYARDRKMSILLWGRGTGTSWYEYVGFDNISLKEIEGAETVPTRDVKIKIGVWDNRHIGGRRIRNQDREWRPWQDFSYEASADDIDWVLSSGSGSKTVEVQVRDKADNESPICSDTVISPPAEAWFQTEGGDVHAQTSISDPIPEGEYFSLMADGYPGVVSYGTSYDFKEGSGRGRDRVSEDPFGWLARSLYQAPTTYGYDYFAGLIDSPTPLEGVNWDGGVIQGYSGFYIRDGNLRIQDNDADFGSNKLVVLVNGDLYLNKKVRLNDVSGFVAFIVKGNIYIHGSLTSSGDNADLEGVYIADGTINTANAGSINNQFRGKGMFVSWSNVNFQRDFEDTRNNDTPAEEFVYLPALWMNAPKELLKSSYTWQELAP